MRDLQVSLQRDGVTSANLLLFPLFVRTLVGMDRVSARAYLTARLGEVLGTRILNLIPMGHDEKPRTPVRKSVRRRLR
jgi:hypothetical protein